MKWAKIMNLSSEQIDQISSQQCISIEQAIQLSQAIIGMQYQVEKIDGEKVYLTGWNHGGYSNRFYTSQLHIFDTDNDVIPEGRMPFEYKPTKLKNGYKVRHPKGDALVRLLPGEVQLFPLRSDVNLSSDGQLCGSSILVSYEEAEKYEII